MLLNTQCAISVHASVPETLGPSKRDKPLAGKTAAGRNADRIAADQNGAASNANNDQLSTIIPNAEYVNGELILGRAQGECDIKNLIIDKLTVDVPACFSNADVQQIRRRISSDDTIAYLIARVTKVRPVKYIEVQTTLYTSVTQHTLQEQLQTQFKCPVQIETGHFKCARVSRNQLIVNQTSIDENEVVFFANICNLQRIVLHTASLQELADYLPYCKSATGLQIQISGWNMNANEWTKVCFALQSSKTNSISIELKLTQQDAANATSYYQEMHEQILRAATASNKSITFKATGVLPGTQSNSGMLDQNAMIQIPMDGNSADINELFQALGDMMAVANGGQIQRRGVHGQGRPLVNSTARRDAPGLQQKAPSSDDDMPIRFASNTTDKMVALNQKETKVKMNSSLYQDIKEFNRNNRCLDSNPNSATEASYAMGKQLIYLGLPRGKSSLEISDHKSLKNLIKAQKDKLMNDIVGVFKSCGKKILSYKNFNLQTPVVEALIIPYTESVFHTTRPQRQKVLFYGTPGNGKTTIARTAAWLILFRDILEVALEKIDTIMTGPQFLEAVTKLCDEILQEIFILMNAGENEFGDPNYFIQSYVAFIKCHELGESADIQGLNRGFSGANAGKLMNALAGVATTSNAQALYCAVKNADPAILKHTRATVCNKYYFESAKLILYDEVDKMGSGSRGSAILNTLTTVFETGEIENHFLQGNAIDTSQYIMVATANNLPDIPLHLKDRTEPKAVKTLDRTQRQQLVQNRIKAYLESSHYIIDPDNGGVRILKPTTEIPMLQFDPEVIEVIASPDSEYNPGSLRQLSKATYDLATGIARKFRDQFIDAQTGKLKIARVTLKMFQQLFPEAALNHKVRLKYAPASRTTGYIVGKTVAATQNGARADERKVIPVRAVLRGTADRNEANAISTVFMDSCGNNPSTPVTMTRSIEALYTLGADQIKNKSGIDAATLPVDLNQLRAAMLYYTSIVATRLSCEIGTEGRCMHADAPAIAMMIALILTCSKLDIAMPINVMVFATPTITGELVFDPDSYTDIRSLISHYMNTIECAQPLNIIVPTRYIHDLRTYIIYNFESANVNVYDADTFIDVVLIVKAIYDCLVKENPSILTQTSSDIPTPQQIDTRFRNAKQYLASKKVDTQTVLDQYKADLAARSLIPDNNGTIVEAA